MTSSSLASFAPLSIDRSSYHDWNAIWLRRGPLALVLVPDVGGRIMGIRYHDCELSFINPELAGQTKAPDRNGDVHQQKRTLGFPLWGGEKTWLAPQEAWNHELPFLDLDSGRYELALECAGTGTDATIAAHMTSPVCRESGMRITRVVRIRADQPGWSVDHVVENKSSRWQTWAPWTVAMVQRPADVYLFTNPGSLHPMGIKTFANEGDSVALREQVITHHDDLVQIACDRASQFKYGADSTQGAVLAIWSNTPAGPLALRRSIAGPTNGPYAHECTVEVFNAATPAYCELELHGPCVPLAPGAKTVLQEWSEVRELVNSIDPRTLLTARMSHDEV